MIKFEHDQLQKFSEHNLRAFTLDMVAHLKDKFPDFVDAKTDSELYRIVDSEIAFARQSGFVGRGHLRRYISLVGALGAGFGSSLEWARNTLANEMQPTEKIADLEETAVFIVKEG